MQLIQVQPTELRAMLTEVLDERLEHHLYEPEPSAPEMLSRRQVSKLLGISLTTVDLWTRAGKLRKHRNGKTVRFKRDEVLAAFKAPAR